MIHNNRDHGYGWDQNHGITRNYDLKIQDHGFPQIKITWSQDLLRSKSWDHGFFDHGSQKLQFVRSCDHDLLSFFGSNKKKIIEIKFPRSLDHEFSWSQIEYSEKIKHISFPFCGVPAVKSHWSLLRTKHTKNGGNLCPFISCVKKRKRTYSDQ